MKKLENVAKRVSAKEQHLDRLSRSKTGIRNELQFFKGQGIRLKVIDLPTTMMELPEGQSWVFEMVNNILIEVMGTIAEQDRSTFIILPYRPVFNLFPLVFP